VENKKGFVRKHFFINRKMQGRYMMTFLLPMLGMLVFFLFILYFATQNIINTTTAIIKDEIDSKIAVQTQDVQQPTVGDYEKIVRDIKTYIRDFSADQKYRRAMMSLIMWIFGIGILLIIIQIAFLTVFFSHRLAGPLYRFEKACHTVIDGNYTDSVTLRKGDEMQNLAQLFNEMTRSSADRLKALYDASDKTEKDEIVNNLKI
jgi:nitrogen fixation/metabolism regulation signal transduction histidine kinase